jgi:hypothetical protein
MRRVKTSISFKLTVSKDIELFHYCTRIQLKSCDVKHPIEGNCFKIIKHSLRTLPNVSKEIPISYVIDLTHHITLMNFNIQTQVIVFVRSMEAYETKISLRFHSSASPSSVPTNNAPILMRDALKLVYS